MHLDPPAPGDAGRRFRRVLVWSGLTLLAALALTLLAALALTLTLIIASLPLSSAPSRPHPQPHRCSSARRPATPCPSSTRQDRA